MRWNLREFCKFWHFPWKLFLAEFYKVYNTRQRTRFDHLVWVKLQIFHFIGATWLFLNLIWQFHNYFKLCCIWQISWMSNWKIKTSFNEQRTTWNFLIFWRVLSGFAKKIQILRDEKTRRQLAMLKQFNFHQIWLKKDSLIIFLIKC